MVIQDKHKHFGHNILKANVFGSILGILKYWSDFTKCICDILNRSAIHSAFNLYIFEHDKKAIPMAGPLPPPLKIIFKINFL